MMLLPACAMQREPMAPPTRAAVPVFAKDDARVATAGFVQQTLRLPVERDGVTYTLMAFVVGEQATLGAMVKGGAGRGTVRWVAGDHRVALPFDTQSPGAATEVTVDGAAAAGVTAQGAAFRGTAWTNIEVPAQWLGDGAPLALEFAPDKGGAIALPAAGAHYAVALTPR